MLPVGARRAGPTFPQVSTCTSTSAKSQRWYYHRSSHEPVHAISHQREETGMNRRNLLKTAMKSAAAALVAPTLTRAATSAAMFNHGRYALAPGSDQTYSARAIELVQRSTVIDMLAPLWISPSATLKMLGNPENFKAEDYAPYQQSGINVFHIAIGTGGTDAYLETLQFLSGYNNFLARHD